MAITNPSYQTNPLQNTNYDSCYCTRNFAVELARKAYHVNAQEYLWLNFLYYDVIDSGMQNQCFSFINEPTTVAPLRMVRCGQDTKHDNTACNLNKQIRNGEFLAGIGECVKNALDCSPCIGSLSMEQLFQQWIKDTIDLFIRRYTKTILMEMIEAINRPVQITGVKTSKGKNVEDCNTRISLNALQDGVKVFDATTLSNFNYKMLSSIVAHIGNYGNAGSLLFIIPSAALEQIMSDLRQKFGSGACCDMSSVISSAFGRYYVFDRFTFYVPVDEGEFFGPEVTVQTGGSPATVTGIPAYVIAKGSLGMMSKVYPTNLVTDQMQYISQILQERQTAGMVNYLGSYGSTLVTQYQDMINGIPVVSGVPSDPGVLDTRFYTPMNMALENNAAPSLIGQNIRLEALFGIIRIRPAAAVKIVFNKTDVLGAITN